MSSQTVQHIKAHFLTTKQFNDKQNPAADELWFTKMPHWIHYSDGGCLGIITQPTVSGNEIYFYSGASFIVHCGKYADGTNKNQIVYIDEDKYVTVNDDGQYCFDEYGNIVVGAIEYDAETNTVSVDGVSGNYTKAVQSFTYDGSIVTLSDDIKPISFGGGVKFTQNGNYWEIDYGNGLIEQGGINSITSNTQYISFPTPMKDNSYQIYIAGRGSSYYYGNGGCIYNSYSVTQNGFYYYSYTSYVQSVYWSVKGLKS